MEDEMTADQQTILIIKGAISELPAADREACEELVDHLRRSVKMAGPIGLMALALVGAEAQAESPQ